MNGPEDSEASPHQSEALSFRDPPDDFALLREPRHFPPLPSRITDPAEASASAPTVDRPEEYGAVLARVIGGPLEPADETPPVEPAIALPNQSLVRHPALPTRVAKSRYFPLFMHLPVALISAPLALVRLQHQFADATPVAAVLMALLLWVLSFIILELFLIPAWLTMWWLFVCFEPDWTRSRLALFVSVIAFLAAAAVWMAYVLAAASP